jgi:hypothetical protein
VCKMPEHSCLTLSGDFHISLNKTLVSKRGGIVGHDAAT